jgi:hypothetical protein
VKALLDIKTLKMIGGGAIILAAAFVMLPGLESYLGGLMRIGLYIGAVLLSALILSRVYATIIVRSGKRLKENADDTDN